MIALVVVGVLCWWVTRYMDLARIRNHMQSQGHEVLQVRRSYFGPGWMGERNARIYWVQYRDFNGEPFEVYCKTSMLAGVYITTGAPPGAIPEGDRYAKLEQENRRLREENALLRNILNEQKQRSDKEGAHAASIPPEQPQ